MNMYALILASVLTTCAGQVILTSIILIMGWFSVFLRYAASVLFLLSSVGGVWFVLAGLTGGETQPPALVFAGAQALAMTLVVGSGLRGIVHSDLEHDTNTRIREMQGRGQHDQPEEQADREEGHKHRTDIDARLVADTEARRQERQDDRDERAEERQADREEKANETK